MAQYMLGENAKQFFASTYQFHLPTEEELAQELSRRINEISRDLATEKGNHH